MRQLRVLIVEDEAVISFLLGETLRGMGYDVCATEGTEAGAVTAAKTCKPDLMIVDEHLGGGSGLAVVEEVLRSGPVPYVFVTGDAIRIKKVMPGSVVMEKPYRETDLARSIQRAMNNAISASFSELAPVRDIRPNLTTGCTL